LERDAKLQVADRRKFPSKAICVLVFHRTPQGRPVLHKHSTGENLKSQFSSCPLLPISSILLTLKCAMFAWERGTPDLTIGKRTLRESRLSLICVDRAAQAVAMIESQAARIERERSSRESLKPLRGNTQRANMHPARPGLNGWFRPGSLLPATFHLMFACINIIF
jgi:hypothetical protein